MVTVFGRAIVLQATMALFLLWHVEFRPGSGLSGLECGRGHVEGSNLTIEQSGSWQVCLVNEIDPCTKALAKSLYHGV